MVGSAFPGQEEGVPGSSGHGSWNLGLPSAFPGNWLLVSGQDRVTPDTHWTPYGQAAQERRRRWRQVDVGSRESHFYFLCCTCPCDICGEVGNIRIGPQDSPKHLDPKHQK